MDAILQDQIDIKLAGQPYKMRRVTTKEVFLFADLISQSIRKVGPEIFAQAGDDDAVMAMGMQLMAAITGNGEVFAEFYGVLLGMTAEQFLALPPEAAADFLEELPRHQDMRSFFNSVARVMTAMGSLWRPA